MSQNATPSAAVRRKAWERFCASGETGHLGHLPPHVVASWQRSRECGVDPGTRSVPVDPHFRIEDRYSRQLSSAAGRVLETVEAEIATSSILVILTDADGTIIRRGGDISMVKLADSISLIDGANVAERVSGTNGCGSSLVLGDIMPVDLHEHYCEGFFDWADVGASIIHPSTGAVIGAIDLIRWREALNPELIMLARTAGINILSNLSHDVQHEQRQLADAFRARRSSDDVAAFAVGHDCIIVAANGACERWLNIAQARLQGCKMEQIPRLSGKIRADIEAAIGGDLETESELDSEGIRAIVEPVHIDGECVGVLVTLPSVSYRAKPQATIKHDWNARFTFRDLISKDAHFNAMLALAERAAITDMPVLIVGETGTGKELVAHAVHAASHRAARPFVTVNCGAIPEELIASELFGYEKGAFTGASASGKAGKFAVANGGTIFLDEITETSAAFQVALLRALQDQEIVPIGADRPVPMDVRVIAATNRNVEEMLATQTFRPDLYYRIASVSLHLPPLRERTGDLAHLIEHLLREFDREITIDSEAMAALLAYEWPGNVRELRMVLGGASVASRNGTITLADLPARYTGPANAQPADVGGSPLTLRDQEFRTLCAAIDEHRGNIRRIAAVLGLARSSLYRKIQKYDLEQRLDAARGHADATSRV